MKSYLLHQRTRNLGDDMQTLAVARLLRAAGIEPAGSIDRERVSSSTEEGLLPMCAWWKFSAADWPPAPGIVPLPMGVHLSTAALVEGHEDWWHAHRPIGCRDSASFHMLCSRSIAAWISGCVTMTLGDWTPVEFIVDPERETRLADVLHLPLPPLDLPEGTTVLVDTGTVRGHVAHGPRSIRVSHQIRLDVAGKLSLSDRLYLAERLLRAYYQAHVVIGTRLHAHLPALALGRTSILLGATDARTADYCADGGLDIATRAEMFRSAFAKRIEEIELSH